MKKFLEVFGLVVFSIVTVCGGFIVFCLLTDREDLLYELKERCKTKMHGACCCGGSCHDDDEDPFTYYDEEDEEEVYDEDVEDAYDEDEYEDEE